MKTINKLGITLIILVSYVFSLNSSLAIGLGVYGLDGSYTAEIDSLIEQMVTDSFQVWVAIGESGMSSYEILEKSEAEYGALIGRITSHKRARKAYRRVTFNYIINRLSSSELDNGIREFLLKAALEDKVWEATSRLEELDYSLTHFGLEDMVDVDSAFTRVETYFKNDDYSVGVFIELGRMAALARDFNLYNLETEIQSAKLELKSGYDAAVKAMAKPPGFFKKLSKKVSCMLALGGK